MTIIEKDGMRELTRDECDELNERLCPLSHVAVDEVKLVEQQMRRLFPERHQSKFLYHFTNPDVVGIWLDDYAADFRCTYYRDLNDRLEWLNGIEYVSEYVREHGYDSLADAIESLPEKDGCAPWVCCFSENEDSAAMWGMYGDRKIGGFAVGFDKNMMMQLVDDRNSKRQGNKCSSYDYWLLPCIYLGDPRLDKIIDYILNDAHADEDEHLFREGCEDEVFARQINRMFFLTLIIKDSSFGYEREWRLITRRDIGEFVPENNVGVRWSGKAYVNPRFCYGLGLQNKCLAEGCLRGGLTEVQCFDFFDSEFNVTHTDATLVIAHRDTQHGADLMGEARKSQLLATSNSKPCLVVFSQDVDAVVTWLRAVAENCGHEDLVLNVAGQMESEVRGIQVLSKIFIRRLLRRFLPWGAETVSEYDRQVRLNRLLKSGVKMYPLKELQLEIAELKQSKIRYFGEFDGKEIPPFIADSDDIDAQVRVGVPFLDDYRPASEGAGCSYCRRMHLRQGYENLEYVYAACPPGGLECPDDTGCLTKGERVPSMLEVKFIQWFRNIEHAYEEAKQMESPSLLQDVDRQKRLWMIHRAELESVLRVHNGFDANDCWRIPPPSVPREGWRKHSEVRTKDQMVEWGEEIWGDYRRNNFHNSL